MVFVKKLSSKNKFKEKAYKISNALQYPCIYLKPTTDIKVKPDMSIDLTKTFFLIWLSYTLFTIFQTYNSYMQKNIVNS